MPGVVGEKPQPQCSAEGLRRTRRRLRWEGAGSEVGRLIHRSRQARGSNGRRDSSCNGQVGTAQVWSRRRVRSQSSKGGFETHAWLFRGVQDEHRVPRDGHGRPWSHITSLLSCYTTHARSPEDDIFGDQRCRTFPNQSQLRGGSCGRFIKLCVARYTSVDPFPRSEAELNFTC
jgi:hypothetical protein